MLSKTDLLEEKPIPELPEEIIDAIDRSNLLLFVGAGVSKLIGYPLWIELAKNLVNKCVEKKVMSLSEKEILLSGSFSPMQIVTIASKRLDKIETDLGISSIIKELDKKDTDSSTSNKIALYLANYYSPIITTNADRSLELNDNLSDRAVLDSFLDYNEDYDDLSIIHLHGSIKVPNGMVFTSEQYAKSYSFDADFGKRLNELFDRKDWTILFLGYSVGEFELLRYFLKKKGPTRKLFMLSGYLNKDLIKLDFDTEYYDSLGITLLPYSREEEDYKALVTVLEKWDEDVKQKTMASSLNKKSIIDRITKKKPTDVNAEKIIKMVDKHG